MLVLRDQLPKVQKDQLLWLLFQRIVVEFEMRPRSLEPFVDVVTAAAVLRLGSVVHRSSTMTAREQKLRCEALCL